MPFKSEAQRRFMWAKHPEMAQEWQAATPKGRKLPEKVKQSFVMYESMLRELSKVAYREADWMTPEQSQQWQYIQEHGAEAWRARQAGQAAPAGVSTQARQLQLAGQDTPLPTQVEPSFARSQRLMRQNVGDLPLVGAHGEYYKEALPTHMRAGTEVTPQVQAAARRAGQVRGQVLHERLQRTGQVYQHPMLEKQLETIPGHPRELTRTGTQAKGGQLSAPADLGKRPAAGTEATQLAGHGSGPIRPLQGSGLRVPLKSGIAHEATQVAPAGTLPAMRTPPPKPTASMGTAVTQVGKLRPPMPVKPTGGMFARMGAGLKRLTSGFGGKLLKAAA